MFTATRPRLLVIDDDRSILTLIGTVALAEGFDVVTTVDGREALAHLRDRPADLVLVDLRMPGLNGWDVIEHIKKVSPETEVIISTANVAFLITRLMLFLGQFNYGKRGILDLTHTRLLTFASFPLYRLYELAPPVWLEFTKVQDQQLAGLLTKILGGFILLGYVTALFFNWAAREREEKAHARSAPGKTPKMSAARRTT